MSTLLRIGLLLAWIAAVVWRAWVTDDAFITLRTVDNALNGYGLRWNVIERVQAYTHPLWMLLTLAVTSVIGSAYHAVLWSSIACSTAAAAVVIWRLAADLFSAAIAVLLFSSSVAFLDYSTSGLENPLTHLLVAVFALVWVASTEGPRRTFWLASVLSALMLNRIDAGLLVLPAFLVAAYKRPLGPHMAATAMAFVPLAVWEVFSLIYYGFLFPNTAYAKLSTGVDQLRLLRQGMFYVLDLLQTDIVTFATIAAALGLTLVPSKRALWPLALGIALYLLYILRIGGDFMAGRFFSAPFFLAVIVLCRAPIPTRWAARASIVLVIVIARAALAMMPPDISRPNGITDQRRVYGDATRLVTQSAAPVEEGTGSRRGLEFRDKGPRVATWGMIGMVGFYAGPTVHLVDPFALADPLLARLPANPDSRIGHFERRVPPGYLASIRSGKNQIEYDRIAKYYDDLVLVTRGPIWSWARWRAILRLNTVARSI